MFGLGLFLLVQNREVLYLYLGCLSTWMRIFLETFLEKQSHNLAFHRLIVYEICIHSFAVFTRQPATFNQIYPWNVASCRTFSFGQECWSKGTPDRKMHTILNSFHCGEFGQLLKKNAKARCIWYKRYCLGVFFWCVRMKSVRMCE